jgi:hypothetical protein
MKKRDKVADNEDNDANDAVRASVSLNRVTPPVFRIRIHLIRIRIQIQPKISVRIMDPDSRSRPCRIYRKNNF